MEQLSSKIEDVGSGVRISHKDNSSPPVVSIPMKDFPFKHWEEWNLDCRANFNDIRWAKAWSDHLKAQLYDELVAQLKSFKEENKEELVNSLGLLNTLEEEK